MRVLFTAVVALAAVGLLACSSTGVKVPGDVAKAVDETQKAAEDAEKAKAEAEAKELEARKTAFAASKEVAETKFQELLKQINDADGEFQAWFDKATPKAKKDKTFGNLTKTRDELKAQLEPLTKQHDEVVAWFDTAKDNPAPEDEGKLGDQYGELATKEAELITKYGELKAQTEAISTKYKF
ncbi:MAG: hypothetical protein JXR83_10560 [Deltaproteobacteria bacterium]|nr:hypothetical protein [Deltaproteobacteria bacterium]